MNNKERKKILKYWAIKASIYIAISIPLAFLLMKVIELKYNLIFWIYFAIMGVSALISEFYDGEEEHKKNKFVKIADHLTFICFITLMICWVFSVRI